MSMYLDPQKDPNGYRAIRAQWLARHPGAGIPCPKCGGVNLPQEDRCTDCGFPLDAPPPQNIETSPDAPTSPVANAAVEPVHSLAPDAPTPSRSAKNGGVPGLPRKFPWGWMAVGVAAAIAAGGTGIALYLGQVQHLGQAEQQLQRDARALHQHPRAKAVTLPSPSTKPSSSPPKSTPALLPSQIPAAVRGYQDIIEGRLATFGNYIEFPAQINSPTGRRTVTVMVDTGNGNDDAVTPSAAKQLGLRVIGHGLVGGVVGSMQSEPIYAGFALVPQGHYAAGQPGALTIPKVITMPNEVGGADINLGQATLAHGAQIAENNGVFWFGWNPSGSKAPQPNSSPPPSAPPPSTAPPAIWHTFTTPTAVTPTIRGYTFCDPAVTILTNAKGRSWTIHDPPTGKMTWRWQGTLVTAKLVCPKQPGNDMTITYEGTQP